MKRKLSILVLLCVLLTGCSSNSSDNSNHDDNTLTDSSAIINESLIRDSENVKFKYTAAQNEQDNVSIYSYNEAKISKDSFWDLFSAEPLCEEISIPNGFREEYFIGDESGVIMERNGELSVQYNTFQGEKYFSVEYDFQFSNEKTEFDFSSRKDISDKLESTVNELLGITIKAKINAVSSERFSKDVDAHIKNIAELDDNPPAAEEYGAPADFYVVSFVQTIDGVPVNGTYGDAVFTKNGLEFLDIFNPVSCGEKVSTSDLFMGLDGAEKLLKAKYDLLFLDEPVEVISGELKFIISDGKLTPAWEFTMTSGIVEYYDAYSGKEIVVNTGEGA